MKARLFLKDICVIEKPVSQIFAEFYYEFKHRFCRLSGMNLIFINIKKKFITHLWLRIYVWIYITVIVEDSKNIWSCYTHQSSYSLSEDILPDIEVIFVGLAFQFQMPWWSSTFACWTLLCVLQARKIIYLHRLNTRWAMFGNEDADPDFW